MSEDEKRIEQPNVIDIVEKIIEFNRKKQRTRTKNTNTKPNAW